MSSEPYYFAVVRALGGLIVRKYTNPFLHNNSYHLSYTKKVFFNLLPWTPVLTKVLSDLKNRYLIPNKGQF